MFLFWLCRAFVAVCGLSLVVGGLLSNCGVWLYAVAAVLWGPRVYGSQE